VQCLYPPPGSASMDYGILRSFAGASERDAFYGSPLFNDWLAEIEPMVEGRSSRRHLSGLEAWFRDGQEAVATAVENGPLDLACGMARQHARAGGCCAGPRTEASPSPGVRGRHGRRRYHPHVAMPFLVKLAHPWLR
jgi:hypothetical protein